MNSTSTNIIKETKFSSFARILVAVLMSIFMGLLSTASMLHTTVVDVVEEGKGWENAFSRGREALESVIYLNDSFLANIIWLVVFVGITFLVFPYIQKLPFKYEIIFTTLWVLITCSIWINSSLIHPSEDSMMVVTSARDFTDSNYGILNPNENYYRFYSFQLGYVFFTEFFIRIAKLFGEIKNYHFLEIINSIFLALSYDCILLINKKIFSDERIHKLTFVIMLFSASPIVFSTFIYGIYPGLAFSLWAIYCEILFIEAKSTKKQIIFGALTAIFIATAVMIKSNHLIFLVVIVLIAIVSLINDKKYIRCAALILASIILSSTITPAIISMYEKKSHEDLGDSIPITSWFAMGLSESDNAPGWYNYYLTLTNFEMNDFDAKASSKSSKEHIKERVQYFMEHPQYRRDFFYSKFVSQWNETTYESIWKNNVSYHFEEQGAIAKWVLDTNKTGVSRYMDIYSQFIFVAVLLGVVFALKDKNVFASLFPLIILGGMLYHLLAEAKSQYAMPYFILMTGFAAYGLCKLYDRLPDKYLDALQKIRKTILGINKIIFKEAETKK